MLFELLQDVRFALRQLRNRPGFSVISVLMLALGVGASAAIFAFVDAALLKPLPFRDPQRLVWTTELVERMGPANLSWQDYEDWQRSAQSFSSLSVWRYAAFLLESGGTTTPVPAMRVSSNFLHTLGLRPALGRDFEAADNLPTAAKVVMLTYGTWQQQFGGRKDLIGQSVRMDGEPYVVIGVLPEGFEFAPRGLLRAVTALRPETGSCEARRSCHSLNGVGRLRDGVTVTGANAEVKRIAARLEQQYPSSNRGQGAVAMPLAEQVVGKIRPILNTLLAGSVLLFVIACLNVASLLLARSDARSREFALRGALGATRARLARQFAVESLVLVAIGIAAGLFGAAGMVRLLFLLIPAQMHNGMPFLDGVRLSTHTRLFALGEALLAALAFAAVPALRVSFRRMRAALVSGTAGSGSLSWRRIGSQIVVLEVATAVVLLVGAGLLSRSLFRLLHVDLGFNPEHLATLAVFAPDASFKTDAQKALLHEQIAERLRNLPGVTAVGYGGNSPVNSNGNTDWIRFVGRPYDGRHNEVNDRTASPGYLQTLGVKLLAGRMLTPADSLGKQRVVLINKKLADEYYPGEDPLGKQFGTTDLSPASIRQVVGVVDNLREGALDDEIWPAEYEPALQQVDGLVTYMVRVSGDERALLPAMVAAVHSVSRDLGVAEENSMGQMIHESQSATLHRGAAWLVGGFAVVALVLCAVGLYGVVMYSVSLRTREIGVRMALGSPRASIYRLILREATVLTTAGLVLGALLAVAAATTLRSLLFQVTAWDGRTLTSVAMIVLVCSFIAGYLPARRAATLNPIDSLRTE